MDEQQNVQHAPYPRELEAMVEVLECYPGWHFSLRNRVRDVDRSTPGQPVDLAGGLTLEILIQPQDAYHPEQLRPVVHFFPVPAATYDARSWRRWLLDRCLDVVRHETCEFFRLGKTRPFAPNHGPGRDPYTIFEYATDEDRRTSFRGELNET